MLLEHPALAALPRLLLVTPEPTRYRAIRAARRADQVSTLEATVQALAMLDGPSFDAAPLLDAFGCFVAGVAARRRHPAGWSRRPPTAHRRDEHRMPTACARPPGSRPAAHQVQQPAHDAFAIGPQAVVGVLVGDPGLQPAHAQRGVLGQ